MQRFFLAILCGLLFSVTAFADGVAGDGKAGRSLFDAWSLHDATEIEFRVNFDSLDVYRRKTASLPAVIIESGRRLDLDVTVRGRYRRTKCEMPPLKLQFKKKGLRAAGFNTHNDFKLVTHYSNDEAGQDALLREQLAYELYQTLAPTASFRTQLLTVHYVNTADGSTTTSYAILIEDTDELKDRLQSVKCDTCYALAANQVDNAETLALFQYMIGNSDYSAKMVRNVKMLNGGQGTYTAVPYDFDFSGLVNASYASAAQHHTETSPANRTLVWEYDLAPDFKQVVTHFRSLKSRLLTQVGEFDGLKASSKREVIRYLKKFFRELSVDSLLGQLR